MIDEKHIEKLAALSRIFIPEEERTALKEDISSILAYVEQIEGADADSTPGAGALRNVMREDGTPHETGAYTEALLREAPSVKDNMIEVKKIIDQG